MYLLSFVYCVEATHASKKFYESNRSRGASGPQPDVEKGHQAPEVRAALTIPVANNRHPQQSISWAPPLDWHSVPGEPEPVLLLSETVSPPECGIYNTDFLDSHSQDTRLQTATT